MAASSRPARSAKNQQGAEYAAFAGVLRKVLTVKPAELKAALEAERRSKRARKASGH